MSKFLDGKVETLVPSTVLFNRVINYKEDVYNRKLSSSLMMLSNSGCLKAKLVAKKTYIRGAESCINGRKLADFFLYRQV